ncbi:MAG: hypothetical protein AVO33_02380 [delta proteobacterium ML8_F1]|nr:MAG: hypothetical protein AVO33_02380 [delta proteobacterium ML8_F1]
MNRLSPLMLLAVSFWAGAFIAGKVTANIVDPVTMTFLRFFIAAAALDGYYLARRRPLPLSLQIFKEALVLALVGMVGYHVLFYTALETTTGIHASLIAALNPFFTYLLSIVFLKTAVHKKKFLYIFSAIFFVSLIIVNFDFRSAFEQGINPGDLAMILGVFLWASYSIILKGFIAKYEPMDLIAVVFNLTVLLMVPFVDFKLLGSLAALEGEVLASILYMGLFPTVFGYLIQQVHIKKIGPERTNIYFNLVPVVAVTLSVIILGESLGILSLFSGLGVVYSVYRFNQI